MRLRFWFKGGLQALGGGVGASVLYGLLMELQMDSGNLFMMLSLYLVFFGACILLVTMMSLYKYMLSMALSFGSTRREALVGMHLYRLLPAVSMAALAVLITLVPGTERLFSAGTLFPLALGVLLLGEVAGTILSVIAYRFGKVGGLIAGVCLFLVGVGAGLLAIFSLADEQSWLFEFVGTVSLTWAFLAAVGVLYLLTIIPEARIVRNYQVK